MKASSFSTRSGSRNPKDIASLKPLLSANDVEIHGKTSPGICPATSHRPAKYAMPAISSIGGLRRTMSMAVIAASIAANRRKCGNFTNDITAAEATPVIVPAVARPLKRCAMTISKNMIS